MKKTVNLEFTVPGEPVAKARPRATSNHHVYTPPKTVMYENRVMAAFTAAYPDHHPTDKPVRIEIEAVHAIPSSWTRKKRERAWAGEIMKISRPDLDNIEKAIMDGLNEVAWRDDSQVWDKHSVKRYEQYGEEPHVSVYIRYEEEQG